MMFRRTGNNNSIILIVAAKQPWLFLFSFLMSPTAAITQIQGQRNLVWLQNVLAMHVKLTFN